MQLDEDDTAEDSRQTAAAEDGVVRALSLANALLNRPGGLTREQIFDKVELYRARRNERDRLVGDERKRADAALEKLFGHDKERLRSCGIDLSEPTSDDDYRYRIHRSQYGLPDLRLSAAERLALYRAKLLFAQNSISGLQHAVWAIDPDNDYLGSPGPLRALQASIGSEAEISQLLELSKIGLHVAVSFRYTGRGRHRAETRRVVPLGTGLRGHWYVLAHDLERDAQRIFRLDRVSGTIEALPPGALSEREAEAVLQVAQHQRYHPVDVAAELDRSGEGFADGDLAAGTLRAHQGGGPKTLPKLTPRTAGQRREDAATKTERVVNMVALLLARDGVQPSELLAKYDITGEQLLRDLLSISLVTTDEFPDTLDLQPFPPLNDEEFTTEYLVADEPIVLRSGGSVIDKPVSLTKPGALSLMIALKVLIEISPQEDQHIAEAAEQLQEKIKTIVPLAIAQAADSMSLGRRADHRPVLRSVQRAISDHHALSIAYTDISGRHSERVIEPVQIIYDGPHIYARAWCRSAEGERFFRLDRIMQITDLPHEPQREESATLLLTINGPQIPVSEDSVPVVLRFSPSASSQAALFHPVKQHTEKGTGARTISTSFLTREAVVRTCLEAGGDIEVLRPVDLRVEIAQRARELLKSAQV
ncbi:helix-turn-helix transcriptional regulator [Nesterenkonia haasae]|uniref:helix-turn-helix transcriptional regulator n=1 Tax=Nesterenkonia haasae TaxID=2587813 RepID=UPI001391FFF7|nr:WYL domain-containing protein [Nesterenkonia haasae]NDK30397.1 WYL domain-containing protein [Nesterenkonia haasae]